MKQCGVKCFLCRYLNMYTLRDVLVQSLVPTLILRHVCVCVFIGIMFSAMHDAREIISNGRTK